jgi:hypothetical protein
MELHRMNEIPACPRCGRIDSERISSRLIYRIGDNAKDRPVARMSVFKCECGTAFTHDTPLSDGQPIPASASHPPRWFFKPDVDSES